MKRDVCHLYLGCNGYSPPFCWNDLYWILPWVEVNLYPMQEVLANVLSGDTSQCAARPSLQRWPGVPRHHTTTLERSACVRIHAARDVITRREGTRRLVTNGSTAPLNTWHPVANGSAAPLTCESNGEEPFSHLHPGADLKCTGKTARLLTYGRWSEYFMLTVWSSLRAPILRKNVHGAKCEEKVGKCRPQGGKKGQHNPRTFYTPNMYHTVQKMHIHKL